MPEDTGARKSGRSRPLVAAELAPLLDFLPGFDFNEEDLEYARRLSRAGVATELHVIPGAFHGFGVTGAPVPQVRACLRYQRDALARAFVA